jgi:hypothetical protein
VSARLLFACLVCSWLAASCTFEDRRTPCRSKDDCSASAPRCYEGFCIPERTTSPSVISGGKGGRSGNGEGGSTAGAAAEGGTSSPDGGGIMTNRPDAEVGSACSGDETRPCDAFWEDAPMLGGCGAGTQSCVNGAWSACTPERMMIGPESCNGFDDDCDGKTDEESDKQCYPVGAAGCEEDEQQQFNCNGACKAGMQECSNGRLGQCSGYIVAETTDNCATEQIDENCDGTPNDNCQCNGNATRECYTGSAGTQGVGICRAGRQQCSNGRWGACQGAVVQRVELCNGDDDDCDRNVDEVVGVGNRCTVPNARGVCAEGTFRCQAGNSAPQCVATSPQAMPETCNDRDDDCNGTADDVPPAQLATDPMHCGDCDTVCRTTDKCCGGDCIDTNVDERNCGICGRVCAMTEVCMAGICTSTETDAGSMCDAMRPCAANQLCCMGICVPNDVMNCRTCGTVCTGEVPACCSTGCADLSLSNDNCGSCGTVCQNPDGGTACACATTGTPGVFECRNGSAACP